MSLLVMRIELIIALISLSGVLVGSIVTFVGNLIQKRFERSSQVHKLIAEKRFEAYENLVASIKWCQISVGEIRNDRYVKYSQIFQSTEDYDNWYVNFSLIQSRFSHLWDKNLAEKLYIFRTYLANLNNLLDELRDKDGKFIDQSLVHEIGETLHEDIQKLCSSTSKEASKFYSTEIYASKFKPSTLFYDSKDDGSEAFSVVSNMLLYSMRPEIRSLINNKLSIND